MNHRKPIVRLAAISGLGLGILALSGCQSARYIDSEGTETIVTLDQINIQDWNNAANELVASLLDSGVLERAPRQPVVLGISRIINNTRQQVDTDSLVKKIRVDLNKTGKVMTTTTVGLGGRVEDPLAKETADYQAFMNDEPASPGALPQYTLSGKLLEDNASTGRTRQVTYSFQLTLTEVATGLAVWEDEKQITKQGKRSSVGW